MGTTGTKEQPHNVTVENPLLMTEAALQQLQSSVGKSVPHAINTNKSENDLSTQSNSSTTSTPLPTIDTNTTVETWRALASSVNDTELQRLRQEYKNKLHELEQNNREKLNLTKENLAAEIEKVEKKIAKHIYTPICELERSEIEQCYLANPKQVLKCSLIAEKFIKCVQQHREQSLQMSQAYTNIDSVSAKTSSTADSN